MELGSQVLPSSEGLSEFPANTMWSHFKTMIGLYRGGVGRVLFQGPYAQGTRCGDKWDLS